MLEFLFAAFANYDNAGQLSWQICPLQRVADSFNQILQREFCYSCLHPFMVVTEG